MRSLDFLTENTTASTGQNIKSLQAKQAELPPGDPFRDFVDHVLNVMQQMADAVASASIQTEAVQPAPSELVTPSAQTTTMRMPPARPKKTRQSGAVPNLVLIRNTNAPIIDKLLEQYKQLFPDDVQAVANFEFIVKNAELAKEREQDPVYVKAAKAAIAGIQLNTRAEIGSLDADIEKVALGFAERFNLPDIWARNLVGMFSTRITGDKRKKFLKACESGNALDITKMIKRGEGSIDDVVSIDDPTVRQVYKDVKRTLLDISLSTGQRGATGPFEAMLAIMGGARKPTSEEGGDLVVERGNKTIKFEVKSGSLSPTGKLLKDGTLPNTGKATQAWLDSIEGKEISGSMLRNNGIGWLSQNTTAMQNSKFLDTWRKSDFRPKGVANLAQVLNFLDRKPGTSEKFMSHLMLSVFPSLTKAPGYNFPTAIKRLVKAVKDMETSDIAKEQGIMACIQYVLGKGNDGFIFFNSTTQEYKLVMGVPGILKLANQTGDSEEDSALRFPDTMTFSGDRCSPSVYYGPMARSKRAKEYFAEFNSDPKRVKLRQQAAAKEKTDAGHEDSEFQRTRSPRPKTR